MAAASHPLPATDITTGTLGCTEPAWNCTCVIEVSALHCSNLVWQAHIRRACAKEPQPSEVLVARARHTGAQINYRMLSDTAVNYTQVKLRDTTPPASKSAPRRPIAAWLAPWSCSAKSSSSWSPV